MLRSAGCSFVQIPCTELSGIGVRTAALLKRCGIVTLENLLLHIPMRYEDRTRLTSIAELRAGEYALIVGFIEEIYPQTTSGFRRNRTQFILQIRDKTGAMLLRFLHGTAKQYMHLKPGLVVRCFGQVRYGHRGCLELIHPDYQCFSADKIPPLEPYLTPVYPSTAGLSQIILRRILARLLQGLSTDQLPDYLKGLTLPFKQRVHLIEMLIYLHKPPVSDLALLNAFQHPYQRCLAFEELLAQHVSRLSSQAIHTQYRARSLRAPIQLIDQILQNLKMRLTEAQKRVLHEISQDLARSKPMSRLLQGDVGSGKTLIALLASLHTLHQGLQCVLMAPTELLAQQHYANFSQYLAQVPVAIACLTSELKGKARKELLAQISQGVIGIVIGTHAVFQTHIEFENLALVMIDEQHRFGVDQRLLLMQKGQKNGYYPHQLVMTATPIPRTLAMTLYAGLDASIIDELPPGRQPICTVVLPEQRRDEVIARICHLVEQRQQVYWVCPLITDSNRLQCQAAESTAVYLSQQLPQLRIGLIHGQRTNTEKNAIMTAFKQGSLDILVATSVIEVGVDIANATLIVIENSERLGLAQLHQLRGRVGRGTLPSYCILLYQTLTPLAKERLKSIRNTQDGFELAQRDLELRGWGELLGTKQTGLLHFKIADLQRDVDLLPEIQKIAKQLLRDFPNRVQLLIQRWHVCDEKYALA